MKALIATAAALGLLAGPAVAAEKSTASSTKTVTTKSGNTKATTTVSTKGNTTTANEGQARHEDGREDQVSRQDEGLTR